MNQSQTSDKTEKFKQVVMNYSIKTSLSKQQITKIANLLSEKQLNVRNQSWQKQNWKQKAKVIISCNIKELSLYSNSYPQIIKEIQHINFPFVKIMWLFSNNIENIENVCFLNSPNLQELYIGTNKIIRVTCLHKLFMPNLKKIDLHNNPLNSIHGLEKAKHYQQNVLYFPIQFYNYDQVLCQDLSQIIRLSPNAIEKVYIHQIKRIIQQKIIKMLQARRFCTSITKINS